MIVVRLFNTVGPRQTGQYGMVIPNFVRQALAGQPITVYGDGTQSRCFTYVGDVVAGLIAPDGRAEGASARSSTSATTRRSRCGRWPSRCKAMTRQRVRDRHVPYDQAYEAGFEDMPRRVPDISKIRGAGRLRAQGAARRDPEPGDRLRPDPVTARPGTAELTERSGEDERFDQTPGPDGRRNRPAQAGQDRAHGAARHRRDRRRRCPRSCRSRAPTSATPSACSARATTCIATRASWTWRCSTKIADECAALGITHVRMHNYGEAFVDRRSSRRSATPSPSASAKSA